MVRAELFNTETDRQTEGQIDGRTDITQLTVAFHDSFYEGVENKKIIKTERSKLRQYNH